VKNELVRSSSMEGLEDAALARLTISAAPETASRAVEEIFRRRPSVAHFFFLRQEDDEYVRSLEFQAALERDRD